MSARLNAALDFFTIRVCRMTPEAKNVAIHFYSLETDALLDLWSRGGQYDWAERLLAAELQQRGISETELTQIATMRASLNEHLAEWHDMSQFEVFGRFIALFGGVMLSSLAGALFGQRALFGVIGLVALIYGFVLTKFMRYVKQTVQRGAAYEFAMFQRGIEQIVVTAIFIFGVLGAAGKV